MVATARSIIIPKNEVRVELGQKLIINRKVKYHRSNDTSLTRVNTNVAYTLVPKLLMKNTTYSEESAILELKFL